MSYKVASEKPGAAVHDLEYVIQLRANNLVHKLCVRNGWSWIVANNHALDQDLIQNDFDRLLEFNEKINELLDPKNKFQWELWAEKRHMIHYQNWLLPRMHNRWKRTFFIALRPFGVELLFRGWRRHVLGCRRKGVAKDVTGIMQSFLMSSLGASYIHHRQKERRIALTDNRESLLLALYCWHVLCGSTASRTSPLTEKVYSKVHAKIYMRKKLRFSLRTRVAFSSPSLIILCWWKISRKSILALKNAQVRVSLGHIRK